MTRHPRWFYSFDLWNPKLPNIYLFAENRPTFSTYLCETRGTAKRLSVHRSLHLNYVGLADGALRGQLTRSRNHRGFASDCCGLMLCHEVLGLPCHWVRPSAPSLRDERSYALRNPVLGVLALDGVPLFHHQVTHFCTPRVFLGGRRAHVSDRYAWIAEPRIEHQQRHVVKTINAAIDDPLERVQMFSDRAESTLEKQSVEPAADTVGRVGTADAKPPPRPDTRTHELLDIMRKSLLRIHYFTLEAGAGCFTFRLQFVIYNHSKTRIMSVSCCRIRTFTILFLF